MGISYNAYPIQELDSTIGVSLSKGERTINLSKVVCEGEHSKSNPLTDDDTPIIHFIPKQLRSRLCKTKRNHAANSMDENTDDVRSTPSEEFSMQMSRSVKRTLKEQFILLSAKKPHIFKSKSSSQTETIDIPDDPSESKKTKKGKKKLSSNAHKKRVRKGQAKQSHKLVDKINKKLGKRKRQVYPDSEWENQSGNEGVQTNMGGGFVNDPFMEEYSRVDEGAMLPLHRLLFDVVHKIILRRKQKCSEANYLYLTLMELLLSRHSINLSKLMLFHIHFIGVEDKKLHALGYGIWLGEIFEYLKIPVKRLRAKLTLKDEEISALKVSHTTAMDQLHVSYGLEHARLVEENAKLKEDLAKSEVSLEAKKYTNSANLKGLYDLFKSTPPCASPLATFSQIPLLINFL
ncbi:hypothetical protein KY285_007740 [Solanum tuberosum]|nr:hypothetical protein KY285_007740 [Solanum tuberosum]